jgi:hypothetical protein
MFRGKYLAGLKELYAAGELEFQGKLKSLARPWNFASWFQESAPPEWVVSAKRPFAGPKQVLAYLSRYTHRVALSNRRLICADDQNVTVAYKDYADAAKPKRMTLGTEEFVRRFCLHVLPERFVKIRHYGLLGNGQRQERLEFARKLLGASPPLMQKNTPAGKEPGSKPVRACCPFCLRQTLVFVREVAPVRFVRPVLLDSS